MLILLLVTLALWAAGFRLRDRLRPCAVVKAHDSQPTLSVIIPARNEAHNLPMLLRSLASQPLKPREIILVDDGSTDRTAELARELGATVIASQAIISGMFSIVYQAINTRILPMFKVEYTSTELRSQIYIGFVNWFLMLAVLFIMYQFRESSRLAAAYGLAVTGDMTLTGIFMTSIFYMRREYGKSLAALCVTFTVAAYLLASTTKIPHGGYWSLVIASIPFAIILLFTWGQRVLHRRMQPLTMEIFLPSYRQLYEVLPKIPGTALFFARETGKVPPYMVHTIFRNNIVYEENIIISIVTRDDPFGVTGTFRDDLAPGLRKFVVQMGYMEVVDIESILRTAGIEEKTIFYGLEEVATKNLFWRLFSLIKRLTPPFVQFYDLPSEKLHGVVQRIEM